MNNTNKPQPETNKIRSSITNKLGRKMFFRLFGLFISLNILICIIAGSALMVYTGNRVNNAISLLETYEPPELNIWSHITGFNVQTMVNYSLTDNRSWPLSGQIWPFNINLSTSTEIIYRGFRADFLDLHGTLRSVSYVVGARIGGNIYEVEVQIGSFLLYFSYAMISLLIFQFFMLLTRGGKDRKIIRRTLDPIAELARAAQTLNEVNKQLDQDNMVALAGRLDDIDAGHLDKRIMVDELQDELKNVAVAINGMLDRINESYAAQARFVSDASHELRTPIAVIQGYANLLDRWGTQDEKALNESITAIKDEAENMKDLVEQLLFLARGDSNRIKMQVSEIKLKNLVNEIVDESRLIDENHVYIVQSDDSSIIADRGLLKQALRILVDNADKYSNIGGEIKISVTSDETNVRLAVSDNGIGISAQALSKVFDRFYRSDESRTRSTGGAGLGLSIAQWITTHHNGHMEILSREGIGTRVTIVLPNNLQPPVENIS